jgi:hypothetical protein
MHGISSGIAAMLRWTVAGGNYDEAVNDVLLTLNTSDLTTYTSTTQIKQVRAAAEYHYWRHVVAGTAPQHRFSLDQQSFSPEQVHAHAKEQRDEAELRLASLGVSVESAGTAEFTPLADIHDPYVYLPDERRVAVG